MKKKIFNLILGIIMLMSIVGILTGCGEQGKTGLETKNDVENYLKENYPNEEFEISDRNEIDITYSSSAYSAPDGNTVTEKGYSYKVKSKTTNIEFTVKNDMEFNSINHVYVTIDDYKYNALSKYAKEYCNKKIDVVQNYEIRMNFNLSDYASKDELESTILGLKDYYSTKAPFKDCKESNISVYIYEENGTLKTFFDIDKVESLNDIEKYLN